MILARRQFLRCLTGIIAAPAVVKADALMKVFAPKPQAMLFNPWPLSQAELDFMMPPSLGGRWKFASERIDVGCLYSLPQPVWRALNLPLDPRRRA